MLIDHLSLAVSDLNRSRRFYEAALAPLGIMLFTASDKSVNFARDGEDDFGINAASGGVNPHPKGHICFHARSRAEVDHFHAAALSAGGRDDGAPGLRPQYHAGYYAAFVLDPDGYRIEAVFHDRKPA